MHSIGKYVMLGVTGLLVAAVAFIVWPLQNRAADSFHQKFLNRCEMSGLTFTRVYERSTTAGETDMLALDKFANVTLKTGGECEVTAANSAAGLSDSAKELYTEHNERIPGLSSAASNARFDIGSNSAWKTPLKILVPYDDISKTLLGVVPVLASIAFLTISGSNIYKMSGGASTRSVANMIGMTIGSLLLIVVMFFFAPILMTFANTAYLVSGGASIAGGPLQIMHLFGTVIRISFEFIPVLFIAASLSGVSYMAWMEGRSYMRGGMM